MKRGCLNQELTDRTLLRHNKTVGRKKRKKLVPAKDCTIQADEKEKDAAPKTEEKPKEGKTDAPANDDKKSKDEKSSKEGSSLGKKGSSPKVFYKIDGDKVTREKKICSRCGKGVFMSAHQTLVR